MELPNLPKQNKHKEADFGINFRRWWERNGKNANYELKDSRGKSYISFKEITDEQIAIALGSQTEKGVLIRITNGTIGSPDYIGIKNTVSYIVIKYPKKFVVITIDNLLHEKETYKRKSLTSERACEIATTIVRI